MATPGSGGGGPGGEKPPPFSRFMRRASTILKKGRSNRGSVAGMAAQEATSSASPSTSAAPAPAPTSTTTASKSIAKAPNTLPGTVAPIAPTIPLSSESTPLPESSQPPAPTAQATHALQVEKARALFARYGLTLQPEDWSPPNQGDAARVEKGVRMRVRRTCHRCDATFGANEKTCGQCQHTRCKKCPRYPAKRSKEGKEAKEKSSGGIVVVGAPPLKQKEKENVMGKQPAIISVQYAETVQGLRKPSNKKIGNEDLARRPARQRIKRTCHKCSTIFVGKSKECAKEGCGHLRCARCPREPPNLGKYPNGYPGDSPSSSESWICHSCATKQLPSSSSEEDNKTCPNCKHSQCDLCISDPPRVHLNVMKSSKSKLVNEDVERRLDERLRRVDLGAGAGAA
ncbi:hypothetical protein MMC09_000667 [Bachmanniomyces sp. S44760]|nr:hypothetical protein [Bachmanniomyces sp. S44760]